MPTSFTPREHDTAATALVAAETAARQATDAATAAQIADLEDQINSAGVVDKTYRHQQMIPAQVWNISHGLGKRPSVDVINSSGDTIIGVVEYIDDDNLNIDVGAASGGEAYLN